MHYLLRRWPRIAFVCVLFCAAMGGAQAHTTWGDDTRVPDWVRSSCCGPEDVHHLKPEQVHVIGDQGYRIDGYPDLIPFAKELPSQDGDFWIFYRMNGSGADVSYSPVYCFFAPPRGF